MKSEHDLLDGIVKIDEYTPEIEKKYRNEFEKVYEEGKILGEVR